MINKESVKQRLDREGAGISYTEFTYMLLQRARKTGVFAQ
jgi:tyrosyl-tRNA synthetase